VMKSKLLGSTPRTLDVPEIATLDVQVYLLWLGWLVNLSPV
jgi:hypothetical protein